MTAADVFDPRVFARGLPHDEFRRLRDEEPVSWQAEHEVLDWPAGPGYWAVTRYADVRHVLRTPEVYSSWLGATQIRDPEPDDLAFIRRMILNMDPPEHNRLRRIVSAVFTRRRLERFADHIAERARQLIGQVGPRGRCDLPVEVTDDFPRCPAGCSPSSTTPRSTSGCGLIRRYCPARSRRCCAGIRPC